MKSHHRFTLAVVTLVAASQFRIAPAPAAPVEDTGFVPTTPRPDVDLVVVRERAYGAGGVDLTAYGLGTPDYVQSIYFRLFADNVSSSVDAFTGRVEFPEGTTILGIIEAGNDLGGSSDDGAATETDLLFGVAADPNDYSENARGFECCGGAGMSEYVCVDGTNTLLFGLNITNGVDDFRVILDYGNSFPDSLSFNILSYDVPALGGAVPIDGIQIGLAGVTGSGDFGEVQGLMGIPLTSTETPVAEGDIAFEPLQNLFLVRDGSGDSFVDGLDAETGQVSPDRWRLTTATSPAGITDGPDGLLYVFGTNGGYAVIVPDSDSTRSILIADLAGSIDGATNLPGLRDLFLVRDTSGNTFVDRFSVDSETYTESFTVPSAMLSSPVGIADGRDSRLWAVGTGTGFVSVDPWSGTVTDQELPVNAAGSYVDLTGSDTEAALYLLRDAGSTTSIDRYDIEGDSLTVDYAVISSVSTPIGISDGPGDVLYVLGRNPSGDNLVVELDAAGTPVLERSCLAFSGTYRSLTGLSSFVPVSVAGQPRRLGFVHWASPVPFRGSTRIGFRLDRATDTRIDVVGVSGRWINTLLDRRLTAGPHAVTWDGSARGGARVMPGIYFYRIEAGGATETGRLVLLD